MSSGVWQKSARQTAHPKGSSLEKFKSACAGDLVGIRSGHQLAHSSNFNLSKGELNETSSSSSCLAYATFPPIIHFESGTNQRRNMELQLRFFLRFRSGSETD